MQDLSLHILDIGENSLAAGATLIEISIDEDTRKNLLLLKIKDNGKGLDEETRKKALDPFFSTRKTRRIGLGLPLLAQAAREAEGELEIESSPGRGTIVTARFKRDHIDRKPLGNMAGTFTALLLALGPGGELAYEHRKDGRGFSLDTREIRAELQDVPIGHPQVLRYVKETIKQGLIDINKEGD